MWLLFIASLLVLRPFVQGQIAKSKTPGDCSTSLDCALLGDCVNGRCVCDPGFTGANCQYFDLLPSKQANIEGFDDPAYPTWGTRVIWSNGEWHMISSYIRNRCGLYDYSTNGAYLRASGPHPMGPFTFQEEIVPPFHHGAHVERNYNGGYLIFGDGREMPASTVRNNCAVTGKRGLESEETPLAAERDLQNTDTAADQRNLYPRGNSPNDVHMVYSAPTIKGPWVRHELPEFQTDISRTNKWDCNKTNLAPLLLENGTVIMGFRSKSCLDMKHQQQNICGNLCQRVGIAISHKGPFGPYKLRPDPVPGLDGNEDPFLWKNKRGYLMVFHSKLKGSVCPNSQKGINTCGSLAYSTDTYTWYLSPYQVYDGKVMFDPSTGKTSETLQLRHRPKILFDNEGTPLVLYNGGQRQGQPYVRSFAFAFNVEEMRNFKQPPDCPPKPIANQCTHHTRRGIVYERTEPGCMMMGSENCIWCPEKQLCMPGTDARICKARSVESFYAHC